MAVAALLATSACDVSQKRPETVGVTLTTPSGAADSATHERSIRLYGPGVSRERQTRI